MNKIQILPEKQYIEITQLNKKEVCNWAKKSEYVKISINTFRTSILKNTKKRIFKLHKC